MFKNYAVTVEGVTPLMTNRFVGDDGVDDGNSRPVFRGEEGTPREQAWNTLYFSGDGETLIIPGPNVFSSLMEAGKWFKIGRVKVTTVKTSLLPACLHLEELVLPIEHKDPWEVDSRPVRIPATGGRIIRHRALFNDWKLNFTLNLDATLLAPKMLREIVDAAGSRIGLGDFRPQTKGPFGKYVVTDWKQLK
jgi:hypothetical protein